MESNTYIHVTTICSLMLPMELRLRVTSWGWEERSSHGSKALSQRTFDLNRPDSHTCKDYSFTEMKAKNMRMFRASLTLTSMPAIGRQTKVA